MTLPQFLFHHLFKTKPSDTRLVCCVTLCTSEERKLVCVQISSLCPEEAAAQEQTGQVEECLKINLLKIKQEACKKVRMTTRLHLDQLGFIS